MVRDSNPKRNVKSSKIWGKLEDVLLLVQIMSESVVYIPSKDTHSQFLRVEDCDSPDDSSLVVVSVVSLDVSNARIVFLPLDTVGEPYSACVNVYVTQKNWKIM